ncbi:hypothetical protein [Bacillus sp. 1NLA3E]|uniref:hypothetical protein n=1 Tax=Bacillus sp. 1NLA3E TaxID=666686 RepID=UPI000247E3EE|nr:hypothetical protein [Bacillus sp. 1NLA3E]
MDNIKKTVGVTSGLIMLVCILLSIKIPNNQYLGSYLFDSLKLSNFRFIIIIIFFICFFVTSQTLKNVESILINWGKLALSLLMGVAFISYIFF